MRTFLIHKKDNEIEVHHSSNSHTRVLACAGSFDYFGSDVPQLEFETVEPTFIRVGATDYMTIDGMTPKGTRINKVGHGYEAEVGYVAMPGSVLRMVIGDYELQSDDIRRKNTELTKSKNNLTKVLNESVTEIHSLKYDNNKLKAEVNHMNELLVYYDTGLLSRIKRFLIK